MKRKYIVLTLCILSILSVHSQEGKKEFIEQIILTYQSDDLSSQNAKEKLFKEILRKSNISFEEGNYTFIPIFDLVSKRLKIREKREISNLLLPEEDSLYIYTYNFFKNRYLTYINTGKLYLTEMYIFKDSTHYGNLVESSYTRKIYFRSASSFKENKVLGVKQIAKKIWQQLPDLLFIVSPPSSLPYFITDNEIKVLQYDSIKNIAFVWDFNSYLESPYFNFGGIGITKRYVPVIAGNLP